MDKVKIGNLQLRDFLNSRNVEGTNVKINTRVISEASRSSVSPGRVIIGFLDCNRHRAR